MALSFTEGSIGGDIESIDLRQLAAFYGNTTAVAQKDPVEELFKEPSGSNGMAIAPSNTRDHHALLLINPHTSFLFRSELQMTSGEGLKPGMSVTRDLVSRHGVLIVAGGHKLDAQSIAALQRIADGSTEFLVYVQR